MTGETGRRRKSERAREREGERERATKRTNNNNIIYEMDGVSQLLVKKTMRPRILTHKHGRPATHAISHQQE